MEEHSVSKRNDEKLESWRKARNVSMNSNGFTKNELKEITLIKSTQNIKFTTVSVN